MCLVVRPSRKPHTALWSWLGVVWILLLSGCREQEALVALPSADRVGALLLSELKEDLNNATAAATEADRASGFGTLGMRLAAHGVLDAARESLRLATALSPDVFEWWYLSGYVAFEQGAMREAADIFTRACDLEVRDVPCASRLVQSWLQAGDVRVAGLELEARLSAADDVAYVRLLRGYVARAEGKWKEAAGEFRTSLALQPEAVALNRDIARCEQMLGRTRAAEALLVAAGPRRVALRDPWVERMMALDRSPTTLMERGSEALASGQVSQAKALFEEASRRGPEDPAGPYNMGVVSLREGGAGEATKKFREALSRDPDHFGSLVSLAGLLERKGPQTEAIELLERAEAGQPGEPRVLLRLGNALLRTGRPAEALQRFETVLRSDMEAGLEAGLGVKPSEMTALAALGAARSASRLGKDQRALEIVLNACTVNCSIGLRIAQVRLLAASRNLEDRDEQVAVELAKELREENSDAEVALVLALAFAANGEFDPAIELQRALLQAAKGAGQLALAKRVERGLQSYSARQKPTEPGL